MLNHLTHRIAPARSVLRSLLAVSLAVSLAPFAFAAPASAQGDHPMPPETAAPPAVSPAMNGIAHIAIRVKDIAASVAFYHKLGFDQAFAMTRGDVTTQSFIKLNDRQFIELYPVDAATPDQSTSGFLHLCFEGADLNALHDFYVAEGLAPIAVRTAGAGNLLFTMKGPQQFADPQNIEYTQYMPGSLHSKDFGQHLGPDRVGDKMTVVALAMQDPEAAHRYYVDKLGFHASPISPGRFNLPGDSGEAIDIVPASVLGARSSIVLSTPDIEKSAAQLTRQQVEFKRAAATSTDAAGHTRTIDMISVTDPDGNILRIAQTK